METGVLLIATFIAWVLADPTWAIGSFLTGAAATGIHLGMQWGSLPKRQQNHTQALQRYQVNL